MADIVMLPFFRYLLSLWVNQTTFNAAFWNERDLNSRPTDYELMSGLTTAVF